MKLTLFVLLSLFAASFAQAQRTDRGVIESPSAVVSGIGFISGWKCNTNDIELWLTGSAREGVLKLNPAQNMPRSDTAGVCLGEENNGFILQVNWNDLIGYDMVVARDNGEEFDSRRFTIGHTGLPFIQDKAGTEVQVVDFPSPGKATTLTWSTATQHFEVARTEEIKRCLGDVCPGSGEGGGEGDDDSDDPVTVNGYTIYSAPNMTDCDGEWETISTKQSDGTWVSGWFCEDEEEYRIENSCTAARSAAWCTVSKTCTDEIHGEYATFTSFNHGGDDYSCYRVKTACLGPGGHLWASVMHNGRVVYMNSGTCFTNVSWTNTFHDIANTCSRDKAEHACHDANGTVVYDTDHRDMRDLNALDNAVSCTWYCDDSDDPVTVNGYTIYSAPNMTDCDGEWETISTKQSDGTWVSGWFCEDEEEYRIENSCTAARSAAWCTVSKTCTDEIHGEYATFTSFNHGGDDYSCYRVKTACLGRTNGFLWASVEYNGHQVHMGQGCFSHADWTNTYFDVIGGCGVFGAEHVCHDADGNVVWDSDRVLDHHTLDNAVSCTWYCD